MASAQASFVADAKASVWGPGGYQTKEYNQGTTTAAISAGAVNGSASGSSWGSLLSTHAYAEASASGAYSAQSYGRVQSIDKLVATGSPTGGGTLRLGIRLGGTATGSFEGPMDPTKDWGLVAKSSVAIWVNSGLDFFETSYKIDRYNPTGTFTPFSTRDYIEIPFRNGQDLWLDTTVYAGVSILNGSGHGIADFSHTFEWTGLRSIVDDNGNAFTGYGLTSMSGEDYVQSVPEPTSIVALGAGALALLKRRKRPRC